ncbi:MAG: hypothetical protein ACM3TT_10605 [Syntrophothermus sp.]
MAYQLTSKELMFLEDHLSMEEFMEKDATHCANEFSDSELKSLCGQIAQDHHNFYQALVKYLGQKTLQ